MPVEYKPRSQRSYRRTLKLGPQLSSTLYVAAEQRGERYPECLLQAERTRHIRTRSMKESRVDKERKIGGTESEEKGERKGARNTTRCKGESLLECDAAVVKGGREEDL
jgi:hypothetical protein